MMAHRLVSTALKWGRTTAAWNSARCFTSAQDKVLLDVDSKSGICTMRLNGPPVNMLDGDMLVAVTDAVKNAEKTKDVRGIIITSKLDGHVFSAGLNVMDMYQKSQEHLLQYWNRVQDWYLAWYGCSKPTAAVVNGHAPAGGCVFAMMCDYRIMQGGAGKTIGLNETQLGIAAPFFFIELMRSAIGNRKSEAALLSGTMFQAEDAHKIGLVDDIDTLENLIPRATEELKGLIAVPSQAYHLTKFLLRQEQIKKLNDCRTEDAQMFAQGISQPKVQESLGMYIASLKARKKQ